MKAKPVKLFIHGIIKETLIKSPEMIEDVIK